MANFFKRGKKIIVSVEKDELRESGAKLHTVLADSLPLQPENEILLNIGACEDLCMESVTVLTAYARECRKVGCTLKVTVAPAIQDQFSLFGLDRHFQVASTPSR